MRKGRIQEMDRSFDLKFWQAQPASVRFQAAWELVLHAWKVKGHDFVNSDFSDLLNLFDVHKVRYYWVFQGWSVRSLFHFRRTKL